MIQVNLAADTISTVMHHRALTMAGSSSPQRSMRGFAPGLRTPPVSAKS